MKKLESMFDGPIDDNFRNFTASLPEVAIGEDVLWNIDKAQGRLRAILPGVMFVVLIQYDCGCGSFLSCNPEDALFLHSWNPKHVENARKCKSGKAGKDHDLHNICGIAVRFFDDASDEFREEFLKRLGIQQVLPDYVTVLEDITFH